MGTGIESIDQLAGPRGTTGQVKERIRGAILSGNIAPGTWLREAKLANQLGVSRIPVREALTHLEAEGFVKRVPFRGSPAKTRTPDRPKVWRGGRTWAFAGGIIARGHPGHRERS